MTIGDNLDVDQAFVKALPKVELHAHLSGSVSKATLHKIWLSKQESGRHLDLQDPLIALGTMPDIFTFFKIFDQYIYKLIDDAASLREVVVSVINDFEQDGVAYLELRTTPRDLSGMDKRAYVTTLLQTIRDHLKSRAGSQPGIEVHLLLSIDRRMTFEQATEVLEIARTLSLNSEWYEQEARSTSASQCPAVLGIDLCGNPLNGDVSVFSRLFTQAKQEGLRTTVHFAEVSESSTDLELTTILSWKPDRLGHVIHVRDHIKALIQEQDIALELCLSCNVIAKLVQGDFADHHLGYWMHTANAIALSTDDIGVFQSSLSNEYLLAASHFGLGRSQIISLGRRSIDAAFHGQVRMRTLVNGFVNSQA